MTATDELRRMLDERGVEWWQSVNMLGCVFTRWYSPLFSDEVVAMENGDGELELFSHLMTPEQAVAATLGSFSCTNGCTNSERTGAPRLPHFWTHDGVLHVELPKLPESISVRLPAQHDREVRSARVWQYTRDNGTCHITDNGPWGYPYVCSACGASFDPDVNGGEFNYCPNCRRRIEVDDG